MTMPELRASIKQWFSILKKYNSAFNDYPFVVASPALAAAAAGVERGWS
jgi:hypothetical protein